MADQQDKIYLQPTGRLTLRLDWSDELTAAPRVNETLQSVTWTLPNKITEVSSSITPTAATITVETDNAPLGLSDYLYCKATLSGGDVLTSRVPIVIKYLDSTIVS